MRKTLLVVLLALLLSGCIPETENASFDRECEVQFHSTFQVGNFSYDLIDPLKLNLYFDYDPNIFRVRVYVRDGDIQMYREWLQEGQDTFERVFSNIDGVLHMPFASGGVKYSQHSDEFIGDVSYYDVDGEYIEHSLEIYRFRYKRPCLEYENSSWGVERKLVLPSANDWIQSIQASPEKMFVEIQSPRGSVVGWNMPTGLFEEMVFGEGLEYGEISSQEPVLSDGDPILGDLVTSSGNTEVVSFSFFAGDNIGRSELAQVVQHAVQINAVAYENSVYPTVWGATATGGTFQGYMYSSSRGSFGMSGMMIFGFGGGSGNGSESSSTEMNMSGWTGILTQGSVYFP